MKRNNNATLQLPFYTLLLVLISGLLMSSGSFPQSSSNNTSRMAQTNLTTMTTSHLPIANRPAGAIRLLAGTPLPGDEIKPLVFNLAFNDAAMDTDLAKIYTPGSPSFHHYLTPEQIVQHYTLSQPKIQQVKDWLIQKGYTIDSIDRMHSSIKVQATVSTIEKSLKIHLQASRILGREVFIQQDEPGLPGQVASLVQSIIGLNNFALPEFQPPFGLMNYRQTSSNATCSKYGARQTLTRNKLAAAYQFNQLYQQHIQGLGMNIGIAEFNEPYEPTDVAHYAACVGIPTPNIQTIAVDGQVKPGSGQGEAAMDIELATGLAPQAKVIVYQASISKTSFAQAMVDVFNRVATDHKVQVLSVSYGTGEDAFSTSEQNAINRSLRVLAAEGISVFISSGDCGAYALRIPHIAQVTFPASAPYAIAVGGTHLQVNSSNMRISETAWSLHDATSVCQNEWGTGGGVSQNSAFRRPSWQIGQGTTNRYNGLQAGVFLNRLPPVPVFAPNGLRQVPDVAAAAYPNIAIYYQGAWLAAGGTSASAPIWAAGTLLVDQALRQQGKALLGSTPEFYTLANHPGRFHPYTDITSGNNLFYLATRGWDYTTGWGSPNFNDILRLELSQ